MLAVQHSAKLNYPLQLPPSKFGKTTALHEKHSALSYRYPEFGPLHIRNYQQYLHFSKDFFIANYGKHNSTKVNMEDFDMLHELGHGTFGNVVLAKHFTSKVHYGIKIISKAKVIKLKAVEQTLQERNILCGLNNPFTIYLVHFFMDNSYLYFVLPYIEGGELFDYLTRYGKFKEPQAQFYIAQVVLGLEYLHSLDLIHRDLKPENILVDHTGYIKLVDFGFSKVLKSQRTYTLCGTPEYMAPEIILNKGHGPPADWWSTGVLVYELVSGKTPFKHQSKMKTYEKIVTNSYEMCPKFSENLKDLVHNLLQTDTTKRFGNLKDGVNDIKHHNWFKTTNWLAILNRKSTAPFLLKPGVEAELKKKPVTNLIIDPKDKFHAVFKGFSD